MGAPKLKECFSKSKRPEKTNKNKALVKAIQMSIAKKIKENPKIAKKAAQIITEMINSK